MAKIRGLWDNWAVKLGSPKVLMNKKVVAVKAFISEELRNSFKSACAKEGKTMSDTLTSFIEQYVTEHENPKPTPETKKGKDAA